MVVFCPADDNEYIYVGHSLSIYPMDPLVALGFDGNLITLGVTTPPTVNLWHSRLLPCFSRTDVRAKTIAEIRGVAGFGAAPPVLRQGPHGGTEPNTNSLSVRPVMLVPTDAIPDIMTTLPAGFYTYAAFYHNFLAAPLGSGVAAMEALYTPLAQWWRAVAMYSSYRHYLSFGGSDHRTCEPP